MAHPSRPLIRRDADGGERTAPSWGSLTERLIREAQDDGAFDDLPHRGHRLPLEDDAYAGEMAAAFRVLRNAGAAPPWIEADKEARRLETLIAGVLDGARRAGPGARERARRRLDELAAEHAAAVARLAVLAPTTRQHRRRIDREALLQELDDET